MVAERKRKSPGAAVVLYGRQSEENEVGERPVLKTVKRESLLVNVKTEPLVPYGEDGDEKPVLRKTIKRESIAPYEESASDENDSTAQQEQHLLEAAVAAALAAEKEEVQQQQLRRQQQYKDVQVRVDLTVAAAEAEEETEDDDDDDYAPEEQLYPWGLRPCFREWLQDGSKKLVLKKPPQGVVDYFADPVSRPYGCTYDTASNTFYATSPGSRGNSNGQIVAMSGNCQDAPTVVASGLTEPAAIAVFEPGLSVCAVTQRGIFVFTRQFDKSGAETGRYHSRQISTRSHHRGIAATANGAIVSFSNGRIRLFDGRAAKGQERLLDEVHYDNTINVALFWNDPARRSERSNACFMDVVEDKLVMSDLQKHVISLWRVDENLVSRRSTIHFVHAIDVSIGANLRHMPAPAIPLGKCSYAAGIRLDAEGWVLCADADGRTIQIYDDKLSFVTRVETPDGLPYISGLCIEAAGHLMVCDRKNEKGGLRVYMMEAVDRQVQQVQPRVRRFY